MAKITFLQGTPSQYASLTTKDANTLYFIFEKSAATASLYLGERYVAGITNLSDLYDVATSDLANDDILMYNLASNKWENCSLADVATKIAVELNYATLQTALDTLSTTVSGKANIADVYTKAETDAAIGAVVVGASHLKRQIVTSINDIDVDAADALAYIYMLSTGTVYGDNKYDEYLVLEASDGERSLERVGSWEVSLDGYAKLDDVLVLLNSKADKGTTLSSYGILDAYSKTEIDSQITALATSIATETQRASDTENALSMLLDGARSKLNTIESGAQANVIDTVNTTEFLITNKQLELKSVPATKISGLDAVDVLKNLNTAVGKNASDIATNAADLLAVTASLNAYVKKTKYEQDIAALGEAVTWHELH